MSLPCGCRFHTRCAVGLVEDNLPNAIASGHDTISCPHYDQSSGHVFRARVVLRERSRFDLYESEADRRSLDARLETIDGQLTRAMANSSRRIRVTRERPAAPPAPPIYTYTRSYSFARIDTPYFTHGSFPTRDSRRGMCDMPLRWCLPTAARRRALLMFGAPPVRADFRREPPGLFHGVR